MLVSTNIKISLLIGCLLYPFFGFYSAVFVLAGFLIDIDHNIEYAIKNRDPNPLNAYRSLLRGYKKRHKALELGKDIINEYRRFHVFHSFEFLILLAIVSFFSKIIYLVFLGFLVHILLDIGQYLYLRKKTKGQADIGRHYFAADFLIQDLFQKR